MRNLLYFTIGAFQNVGFRIKKLEFKIPILELRKTLLTSIYFVSIQNFSSPDTFHLFYMYL